jgi:hypothetical protein
VPVLRQPIEGAAFLWSQQAAMFDDPVMRELHLGRLARRRLAHISGSMAAGQDALSQAERQFDDYPEVGKTFAWLSPALMSKDRTIETLLERIAPLGSTVWSKAIEPSCRWLAILTFSRY